MRPAGMTAVLALVGVGLGGCTEMPRAPFGPPPTGPRVKAPALPEGMTVANKDVVNPLPTADGPVKVDGVLDDAAWAKATAMTDFVLGRSGKPDVQSRVLVMHDAANLHLAIINDEPNTDQLVTNATERDGPVWNDDSVEIYVDANNAKGRDYHGFFVNAANVVYDRRRVEAWDGEWTSAVKVLPGKAWVVEVAIPFATLGVTPKPGHKLGLMVARNRRAGLAESQLLFLVPCGQEAKDTSTYPVLEVK